MLKYEDRGIDRASITSIDGIRIGGSNTIESLLDADFKLIINDATYDVTPPSQERHSMVRVTNNWVKCNEFLPIIQIYCNRRPLRSYRTYR